MKARNGRMLESNKQDLQNVLIRWADGSDAESMARVHVESYHNAYRYLMPSDYLESITIERQQKYYEELIRCGGPDKAAVLSVAGQVAGCLVIGKVTGDARDCYGEIFSIYLPPERQGEGYGRALLDWGIERFGEMGLTHVVLWVLSDNKDARVFYEHAGFINTREERLIRRGTELVQVRYERLVR